MCTKEEYGIKFWLPFLLYYFATTVVFILEARSLTVGLTSIVSLNGCQKTSSVYYKLPLYSSIVGNATGGIVSADAGFYFQDWHVVPSLGFCPSNNPPTNPIPALTPVAQAAADSSRRKLLAAGSSSRSSSSSAGDIDLHNKKHRKLGGAGGSSGGGGGGGGGSSSSSSSSGGSSGNSNNDGNNGGSSAPVTVTGTEGKGEGNFNYKACINFGKTYTGKEDSSGPTIWKQLDKLAGLDGYNGQGAIKTSFTEGAAGLSDASSLMSLILGINCGLWSITSVLFLTYILQRELCRHEGFCRACKDCLSDVHPVGHRGAHLTALPDSGVYELRPRVYIHHLRDLLALLSRQEGEIQLSGGTRHLQQRTPNATAEERPLQRAAGRAG